MARQINIYTDEKLYNYYSTIYSIKKYKSLICENLWSQFMGRQIISVTRLSFLHEISFFYMILREKIFRNTLYTEKLAI